MTLHVHICTAPYFTFCDFCDDQKNIVTTGATISNYKETIIHVYCLIKLYLLAVCGGLIYLFIH